MEVQWFLFDELVIQPQLGSLLVVMVQLHLDSLWEVMNSLEVMNFFAGINVLVNTL